jgi:hypothetical protein
MALHTPCATRLLRLLDTDRSLQVILHEPDSVDLNDVVRWNDWVELPFPNRTDQLARLISLYSMGESIFKPVCGRIRL